jgi:hypothetical protein
VSIEVRTRSISSGSGSRMNSRTKAVGSKMGLKAWAFANALRK